MSRGMNVIRTRYSFKYSKRTWARHRVRRTFSPSYTGPLCPAAPMNSVPPNDNPIRDIVHEPCLNFNCCTLMARAQWVRMHICIRMRNRRTCCTPDRVVFKRRYFTSVVCSRLSTQRFFQLFLLTCDRCGSSWSDYQSSPWQNEKSDLLGAGGNLPTLSLLLQWDRQ